MRRTLSANTGGSHSISRYGRLIYARKNAKLEVETETKMRRSIVIEMISKLPEEVSLEEINERLIVIEKIERGQQQVREGKVNTEEEAKAKLAKWLD